MFFIENDEFLCNKGMINAITTTIFEDKIITLINECG